MRRTSASAERACANNAYEILLAFLLIVSTDGASPPLERSYIELLKETYKDRSYYGGPSDECPHCGAVFWFQERVKSVSAVVQRRLVYNLCCRGGKIVLEPYKCPLAPLCDLLRFDGDSRARRFLRQIRSYNSLFAFTSLGAVVDRLINNGTAPYVFKINGVVHHRIGSLLPSNGLRPQFAQLYIYDTEHEVQNRLGMFENEPDVHDRPDPEVARLLLNMLDEHNKLVAAFRFAKERLDEEGDQKVTLRLLGCNTRHDAQYNLPANDVLGVVSVISQVSSVRTRGRQAEVMKRTVTISNARDTGPTVDVVLWGERATAFPAEQVHRDSGSSPQIIIFVGTLVRSYADNVSLSGGSSCKWYINEPVPEVNALRASAETNHHPVIWDQGKAAAESTVIAVPEHKKLKDIKYLHPFENKKKEWLVIVKVLKIDSSWWYNACKKCLRTTKPHGDTYKCTNIS
ncbi:putative replication protein [Zea mays]|uniref:Putative replication protein n=1 Tax=Zea mays TaxID=4577 RepID=A0A1D6LBP0_MAIZE|nr:putative replication protein [Zea mays]